MTATAAPVKIALVAGEASGDLLGGALLEELRALLPGGVTALGVGGSRMRAAGMESLYNMNELSIIGLVEVIRRLPRVLRILRGLEAVLERERPQLLVTIDLPDFNFRLAAKARKLGIPVVHYVSPQVWAWRSGRVNTIARRINHLLVLFPFEREIYKETGLPVSFVGHPLVQRCHPDRERDAVRQELGVTEGERLVALLPGSRHGELKRLLPVMARGAAAYQRRGGAPVRFVVAVADTLTGPEVYATLPEGSGQLELKVVRGRTYDLVAAADAALVASGTATLETALLGTPMSVVYQVNRLTYEIGRRVIRVPFISLVNLVLGRGLVPERIQDQATPERLADDLGRMLDQPAVAQEMRRGFGEIRQQLEQPPGEAARVVARVLQQVAGG